MDCEEAIYSEDFYDLVITYSSLDMQEAVILPECSQPISLKYEVGYYNRQSLPELSVSEYTYSAIPQCFSLMDKSALDSSGITKVQNQPNLDLKGEGILIGFLDTGIDYRNPVFQSSEANSRIVRIWDQTIRTGRKPENFLYGSEYTKEDIDTALKSENPYDIVPSIDESGHGTFLAGVAAGSEDVANDFLGAAPYAEIAMVKLKPAKQNIRDFYFIPKDAPAYSEGDVMAAISYLNQVAQELNKPLVLCIGLGTNMGSHGGTGPLSLYLNDIAVIKNHVVVVAAGNEANSRHHFYGTFDGEKDSETVEISVADAVRGFTIELWAKAPEIYSVAVVSPTGEQITRIPVRQGNRVVQQFIFEETIVSVDYRSVGVTTGDWLVFFRFDRPTEGLWNIIVYADENMENGSYHMWLPLPAFVSGDVFFLRSNPDVTITVPATASIPMGVGAYDAETGSLFLDSGRGYTILGQIKPDFVAPGVDVYGPGLRNQYIRMTGTSVAAAVAAGACALLLEWAVERKYDIIINTADIKNYILRGAGRDDIRRYPNREWGYGKLDVYEALNKLRIR